MKWLLLLLILPPVILLAQTGRKEVIDSGKDIAAINLQSIPSSMGNNQCTKVADLHITDNGEYTTTVVFHHIITASDSAFKLNTEDIPVRKADTIKSFPPLPVGKLNSVDVLVGKDNAPALIQPLRVVTINTEVVPVRKADTIMSLSFIPVGKPTSVAIPDSKVAIINTNPAHPDIMEELAAILPHSVVKLVTEANTHVSKTDTLTTLLPLPVVIDEIAAIPPSSAVTLNTEDIPVNNTNAVTTLLPLPVFTGELTAISPHSLVILNTEDINVSKAHSLITLGSLPAVIDGEMEAIPPHAAVTLNTEDISVRADTSTTLPPLPAIIDGEMEAIPPHAVVVLNTEDIPISKADAIPAVPALPALIADEMAAIPPHAVILLNTEEAVSKADTATLPPLPVFIADEMEAIPPHSAIELNTDVAIAKADVVTNIPKFEEERTPVSEMHLSPDGYSLLQKMEGYSPELYSLNDGGFTIGFGFFVPYGEVGKWSKGLTWEEAEKIMQQKVPVYENQVKQYINVPLTQKEFDALTMLAYNLGGFSKATSIVNDINSQVGYEKLQSDWTKFVHSKAPNVTKGLMNRRRDELEVRILSDYKPERKIQILKK